MAAGAHPPDPLADLPHVRTLDEPTGRILLDDPPADLVPPAPPADVDPPRAGDGRHVHYLAGQAAPNERRRAKKELRDGGMSNRQIKRLRKQLKAKKKREAAEQLAAAMLAAAGDG